MYPSAKISNARFKRFKNMILDVHVAYLVASLSVLFGLTYSIGQFLDYKIEQIKKSRAEEASQDNEVFVS